MGKNYVETLACQKAAGTLFNTYTSAKSIINPECLVDLPRGFWTPGRRAKIEMGGGFSNIVTTPGTFQLLVKMGPVASQVTVADSLAMQLNASAHVTLPWWAVIDLRADKDNFGSGTTCKVFARWRVGGRMFTLTAGQVDSPQGDQEIAAPATGYVLGAGFDGSIVNTADVHGAFSISNAGNGVRVDDYAFIDMGIG